MNKKEKQQDDKEMELFEAKMVGVNLANKKIATIIEYILNKNSNGWGEVDYKKAYEEIEELEYYLNHQ
jgi:hypothetical protein